MPLPALIAGALMPAATSLVGGIAEKVVSKVFGPNAGQVIGAAGNVATQAVMQNAASSTPSLFASR